MERVPKKFIGGLLNKASRWLFGDMPKSVVNFLKEHGDEYIKNIFVYRAPLDNVSNTFLNVLTLGSWPEIKKKANVDDLFHTYAIINGKYTYEKTENPRIALVKPKELSNPDSESEQVLFNKKITIEKFIENAAKYMGDDYYSYDGFKNNCQDFLVGSLKGNGIGDERVFSFLKQDLKSLIEETPSFSQYLGKDIVDLAGAGSRAIDYIFSKKGGRIPKRFLGGGFENLLGLNKPAPPPAGSTMMEKIGNFMFSGKSDKATKDAMDAITESITGKKVTFARGGHVKKFIQ